MNCWLRSRWLLLLILLAGFAQAEEPATKLIAKYNCLGCHAVDQRIVGPSYKEVAARYRNQKDAEGLLMKEIRSGVQGKWDLKYKVAMPPQQIGDNDLRVIVRWILAQ